MGDSASLLFYIVSFLLSTILVYLGNRKSAYRLKLALNNRRITINPLLIIGAVIPVLIAGFRQNVGTDFASYIVEYNSAIQAGSYLEASFNIIANISNVLFGGPTFMFVAFSAMTIVPVMLALHKSTVIKSEYRWMFWMLFLFIMFPQTFNLLRQGVAVAIGFYLVISVIESHRLFKITHAAVLLLAILFHSSAWVLVPIVMAAHALNNRRKISVVRFVLWFSLVSVVCLSLLPQLLEVFNVPWSGYLDVENVSRSVVPRSILILVVLMVCWKYYGILKITNSYIALLWIGLFCGIGGLFIAYFERVGYYVTLLLPLLVLVMIVQSIARSQTRMVYLAVYALALVYFVSVYYLMGSSDIFPYNWSI